MPEPAPQPRRIAIVRNPRSGSAVATETLKQALKHAGVTAEILDTPDGPQLDDWLDRIANKYDVIAAAGGDGTVSSVAAGVARAGKTLAVIPTGTLNHFAHDLGIPTELGAGGGAASHRSARAPSMPASSTIASSSTTSASAAIRGWCTSARGSSEAAARAGSRPRSPSARRGGACEASWRISPSMAGI